MRLIDCAAIAAIALLTSLTGCSAAVKTTAYDTASGSVPIVEQGLAYYLPRTMIELTVTYQLVQQTTWEADAEGKPITADSTGKALAPKSIALLQEIKDFSLAFPAIPDPRLCFRMDPTTLEKFHIAVDKAEINLSDSGVLTSIDLPLKDRTGEIIEAIAKTAVSVAKTVAVAGREVTMREIVREVTVKRMLDIADFETDASLPNGANCLVYSDLKRAEGLLTTTPGTTPELKIRLTSAVDLISRSQTTANDVISKIGSDTPVGIVYRVPGPVVVEVLVDDVAQKAESATFAQAGGFAWMPLRSRAFASKSSKVTLSPKSGAVVAYTYSTTAAGEGLASALQSVSTELNTLQGQMLDAQRSLLEKETALIEAQHKLEEAKKALE